MASRTLHAVLAGINTYPLPVKPLTGCLHDVKSWQQYLESESPYFKVQSTVLLNEAVTKKALSASLEKALTDAATGDVVFFLFSGHGTREKADPVFSETEQDDALESLVCYDSIRQEDGTIAYDLLADKELHYMISEYAKSGTHILMVFDCCHSGGITRNAWMADENGICTERRLILKGNEGHIAPIRPWDKFLFGGKYPRDQIENGGWLNTVVQKPHITFSACQNDESAYEQNGRGIFTSHLIDILKRTNGSISYYDLQARARLFTQNQFRQTPEAYVIRRHEDDLFRTFLDKTVPSASLGCIVYYKKDAGWAIDLGALHGITLYSGPVILQINNIRHELALREVFSNYTLLEIPGEINNLLDASTAYPAIVENHFSGNTSFFILPEKENMQLSEELKNEAATWIKENRTTFSLTEDHRNATYVVRATKDKFFICQNDALTRPATQVALSDADPVARCVKFMRHIAQWEYIRALSNPDFRSNEYPLIMRFYRIAPDFQKKELTSRGDTIEFDYELNSGKEWTGRIKASVTNKSKTKYYCSILYLSNLFQVYGNILDGKVIGLNPGETVWINNGDTMDLDLEPYIVDFNYPHSIFYLKLIAGTEPFLVESLEQSPLPAPEAGKKRGIGESSAKGLVTHEIKPVRKVSWFTRTVCFKVRNPQP